MPNTTNLSLPVKGMNTDLHQQNTGAESYKFALNAVISDFYEGNEPMLQNEPSNVCGAAFPPGYQVVGFKAIPEQNRVIYFLTNPSTGFNQIGEIIGCEYEEGDDKIHTSYCDSCNKKYVGEESIPLEARKHTCYCNYRMIVSAPCLNFSIYFPVDIEYKITNCGVNLYFTDNFNERRFLYFDYVNDDRGPLKVQDRFYTQIAVTDPCKCPSGYKYNPDTNMCEKLEVIPVTPSSTVRYACKTDNSAYTNYGVLLYSSFNVNGTGTYSQIHQYDDYWSNYTIVNNKGVLNRTALWACGAGGNPQTGDMYPLNEYIGFLFEVNITEEKTYYVGIAGDNDVRIRVNCQTVVNTDHDAMAEMLPGAGVAATFKYWHVYPVTLPAGRHVFELTGYNTDGPAGFGAEIYDNTASEIQAAVNGAGLNILFSTENKVGQLLQVSDTFSGTCPDGSCLSIINETELVCTRKIETSAECDDCITHIVTDQLDCEKIKVHPNHTKPCVEFIEFVNGGNLRAGSYQVLMAYSDIYGNPITKYFAGSQIAPLYDKTITFETNYFTNQALKFELHNLHTNSVFQYYNIVIAQTVDNYTEFLKIGTFPTSTTTHIYTGFETGFERLSAHEVLFTRPFYKTAESVTQANDYLIFGGVKEYPILNLQRAVNEIELNWETVALKEGAYRDPKNTFYFRTYQRDEVYSFGIIFEFNNGRETCVFHIPGREATPYDLEIVTDDILPEDGCNTTVRNKRWQVYNTATVNGGDYEYNDKCEINKCWEYGRFAYWESTDKYPNIREIWGDLCGKPIRHHKFPDSCVSHIHDGLNDDKHYQDANYIFPIGVRVNHQSVLNALNKAVSDNLITQQDKDSIVGYRIVRGNRVGNKSIDAKGLIFNIFKDDINNTYYPNYGYNDLHSDAFINNVSVTNNRYVFHSPDIHFVNAKIGNILKLETEEYGESEGYFTHSECQARHKFLSQAIGVLAFGLGMAAALSATGKKVCKEYVYRDKTETKHGDQHVDKATISPWIRIVGNPSSVDTGSGAIGPHDIKQDNSETTHNYRDVKLTNQETGEEESATVKVAEEKITDCKGQPWQLFNSDTTIGSIVSSVTGTMNKVYQRTLLGIMEMQKILDTMRALIPYINYSTQYNSVGIYNNYACVTQGRKNKRIVKSSYLEPIVQSIDEESSTVGVLETINVNNWYRERSVYLKLNSDLPPVAVKEDDSKVSMNNIGWDVSEDLDRTFRRSIASYYASIKRDVINQYGQICSIDYIETNPCTFYLNRTYTDCEAKVFGGDTFINRFALKRKMPFFLQNRCNMADGTDVLYKELANVGKPKYYFNTLQPLFQRVTNLSDFLNPIGLVNTITQEIDRNWDGQKSKAFYQLGAAHLFYYAIPYFLVESDINVDYRHGENREEKGFYPAINNLKDWLEEENVPIHNDNYYFYNRTYSKQNKETTLCKACISDIKDITCQLNHPNRIIYSEPLNTENKNDNWLIYKANNYYDFPLTSGKLITVDGIENDKVLVRLEKGTKIFRAYDTIETTKETLQIGTGGMFTSRPQDIALTDLGYAGTQHRDILHTEYGHIWGDAERGQIFNLATGGASIDELSKQDKRAWFKQNLPFQIKKDFPNYPLASMDNNLNGVGLHYGFDKRFARLLITKLDYKVLDKSVKYDEVTRKFYITKNNEKVYVELYNPKYFCNKSWTVSYNFLHQRWVSYHSYKPCFYINHNAYFETGFKRLDKQYVYSHNLTNKSYQVFYGKLFPFIVEFQSAQNNANNVVNSIEFYLDVIRYHNEYDAFYNRNITFNKAIIYNENESSGLLQLKVSNPEDLTEIHNYPKRISEGYEILISNSENQWRFNNFWNVAMDNTNIPTFNYDCANVDKVINYKAINYDKADFDRSPIRQKMTTVRLINDKESNYKFIFTMGKINKKQSFR